MTVVVKLVTCGEPEKQTCVIRKLVAFRLMMQALKIYVSRIVLTCCLLEVNSQLDVTSDNDMNTLRAVIEHVVQI